MQLPVWCNVRTALNLCACPRKTTGSSGVPVLIQESYMWVIARVLVLLERLSFNDVAIDAVAM